MLQKEMLRKQYNPDGSDLRNMQLRMLDILKCVDSICRKHNIKYWLGGGTLLGAVRHGGFIPWDDDLDIEMLKDDYNKLMRILPIELPSNYVLQTYKSDSSYIYLWAKIRDLNSQICEIYRVNSTFKYQGIFIDIFAMEPTFKWTTQLSKVIYNRLCFGLILKGDIFRRIGKWNYWLIVNIFFPILRCIIRWGKSDKIGYTLGVNFDMNLNWDDIFPLKKIKFEDSYFFAPAKTDLYLKTKYGDYMKLPETKDIHVLNGEIKMW